jgi:hypothetical protein
VDNLNYYTQDKDNIFNRSGTDSCNQLFQVNLWCNLVVAVLISILSVLQIIKIIFIAKNFFFINHVPNVALCEDEDIIVME